MNISFKVKRKKVEIFWQNVQIILNTSLHLIDKQLPWLTVKSAFLHFLQTARQCQPLLRKLSALLYIPDTLMQGTLSTADMMLCLGLLFSVCVWQDLKPVDVTNKRSLWENKGASPTKVAMMRNVFADQSTSLNQRGKSKSASRWSFNDPFVVLKGFPVVVHGFPDVTHKIVLFKRWCRDIQIISRFWPWCHGSNNHLCVFLF